MNVVIVVPAYNPPAQIVPIVRQLAAHAPVVVVNDGSSSVHQPLFDELSQVDGVSVLRHAINLGKGAALKTAFNFVLSNMPGAAGAVTADADGQHLPADILRLAEALERDPEALLLGVRLRHEIDAPLRSRLGNRITRTLVRLLLGQALQDTQTGLRGLPASLMKQLLKVPSTGYDFELDMLIASKHLGYRVQQIPIETVYVDGNRSSHFNPFFDSMRIYFVLLRFSLMAILTAVIDNAVFLSIFLSSGHVLGAQVAGRLAGIGFNYTAARRAVFLTRASHRSTLPRFLLLVALNATLSYAFIRFASTYLGWSVPVAKLTAEGALFAASFALQRDFVFVSRNP